MNGDQNSLFPMPTSTSTMAPFDDEISSTTLNDATTNGFVVENGARPKVFSNIIDDSPLQNQIQRNKECKIIQAYLVLIKLGLS